ncbi:hypothetical protein M0R19_03235 [Candidatus Pacearchaeota archaeon]|nr:hypothetical protein [Candidatus Pacearchaeota archaeon]
MRFIYLNGLTQEIVFTLENHSDDGKFKLLAIKDNQILVSSLKDDDYLLVGDNGRKEKTNWIEKFIIGKDVEIGSIEET